MVARQFFLLDLNHSISIRPGESAPVSRVDVSCGQRSIAAMP